jgi:hypothetical protein
VNNTLSDTSYTGNSPIRSKPLALPQHKSVIFDEIKGLPGQKPAADLDVKARQQNMTAQPEKKEPCIGRHWIILFILIGSCYGIYTGIKGLLQSQREREAWTEADRKLLIDNCMRDAGDRAVKYPDLMREYCGCSNDRIMSRFSKREYIAIIGKSIDEQKESLLPVFQDCYIQLDNKIKAIEK